MLGGMISNVNDFFVTKIDNLILMSKSYTGKGPKDTPKSDKGERRTDNEYRL